MLMKRFRCKMKIHQIILKDKNKNLIQELRYSVYTSILYWQNRSYDIKMSLDCFLDEL